MSYRIDYQPLKKMRGMEKRTAPGASLLALGVLVMILLTGALWPRGREVLGELLIPGEAAVTVSALENLTEDLCSGESLRDAVAEFCMQVMELDPA